MGIEEQQEREERERAISEKWLDIEKRAMTRDHASILVVVSALRCYRAAATRLLNTRYRDGFVDGVASSNFESDVDEINRVLEEE